jgi:hypothetical protein
MNTIIASKPSSSQLGKSLNATLVSRQGTTKRNRNRTVYRWSNFTIPGDTGGHWDLISGEYVTIKNAIRAASKIGCEIL